MAKNETLQDQLKRIPSVHKLLDTEMAKGLMDAFSWGKVLDSVREFLDELREDITAGARKAETFSPETFFRRVRSHLEVGRRRNLRRVINATGIVLHTNLGRAPLAEAAIDAVAEAAGYSNLELDLAGGKRGSRYAHVEGLLCRLTGAEAALAVNNNAAAVTLALSSFARDGEVVLSRGELVEIGGSFRIPEVIAHSGARLVEVGATNKTHIADYERAIGAATRVLMKVHPSNYRIVGFTGAPTRKSLVELAREHGLMVIEDLGSGALVDLTGYGLPYETTAMEVLEAGVDVLTFSGDKLLGGPQAGILLGKARYIDRMKKNQLLRALRIDKLSLAALEATLRLYEEPERLAEALPLLRMLTQDAEALQARARRVCAELAGLQGVTLEIEDGCGYAGGGALPDASIPTKLVAVRSERHAPDALAAALRAEEVPLIGRIADDAFVMDMRTVADAEVAVVVENLRRALA